MPDHEDSLGGETLDGDAKADRAEQSLGDGATLGGGEASSLSDTTDGEGENLAAGLPVIDLATRFEIEGELGQGGMGAVLLARDKSLGRQVAIKRILGTMIRSSAINRFITEAKSIAALNHPNIVQIYEFVQDDDGPLIVIEYVSGGSLLDRLKKGKLDPEEAIRITCQLCDALTFVHDKGIIHRDIKPANVLMTEDGVPKLTDFGLAKQQNTNHGQTAVGAIMGTIDFMPPEQRRDSSSVDERSDLWSLAATFYQMLTGKSPTVINITSLPPKLQSVVAKALGESKEERFQSALEMREAILQAHSGKMDTSRSLGEGECPECATPNPPDRKFCRECGSDLRVACLSCAESMPVWDNACSECGARQSLIREQNRVDTTKKQVRADVLEFVDARQFQKAFELIRSLPQDIRTDEFDSWQKDLSVIDLTINTAYQDIRTAHREKNVKGLWQSVKLYTELNPTNEQITKLKTELIRKFGDSLDHGPVQYPEDFPSHMLHSAVIMTPEVKYKNAQGVEKHFQLIPGTLKWGRKYYNNPSNPLVKRDDAGNVIIPPGRTCPNPFRPGETMFVGSPEARSSNAYLTASVVPSGQTLVFWLDRVINRDEVQNALIHNNKFQFESRFVIRYRNYLGIMKEFVASPNTILRKQRGISVMVKAEQVNTGRDDAAPPSRLDLLRANRIENWAAVVDLCRLSNATDFHDTWALQSNSTQSSTTDVDNIEDVFLG